jgi:2-dehydropantoate 2-reductase
MEEIKALAAAMGIKFTVDIVDTNLQILDNLLPTASTSMQRDIRQGRESEIDGLIFEVVRLAHQYGVAVPNYTMVAAKFAYNV